MEFKQPPILTNERGEIRKAGFEMEFANLDLDTTAGIIIRLFGGTHEARDKYAQKVIDTEIGDFSLSLDVRLLSEKKYQNIFTKLGIDLEEISIGKTSLDSIIENVLGTAVATVIPNEISMPSLPFTDFQKAEDLKNALAENQAKGTKASILYAFAMHINPELPTKDVETILRYTRAFLLMYPWLFKVCEVDFSRRLTSFINPFPQEYIQLVLNPGYAPDLNQFIDDYNQHNPDRNRPLDLYPVLAYLNSEKVDQLEDLGKVKPRPTFHYRLPNSLIDDPDWSIATEWNRWVEVEKLASSPEMIQEMSTVYLQQVQEDTSTQRVFDESWAARMEEWVQHKPIQSHK
jgi:hypothetical protein